jgi:hypothetical protein
MNLQLLRWLISHRDLLTKIAEAAKGFDRDAPYSAQWEVIDKIARLVVPELDELQVMSFDVDPYEDPAEYVAMGVELAGLNIDWVTLINVILPLLQMILDLLQKR